MGEKGVVLKPMFPRIGVDRFVPPPLHLMMGIANRLLKHMLQYIEFVGFEDVDCCLLGYCMDMDNVCFLLFCVVTLYTVDTDLDRI